MLAFNVSSLVHFNFGDGEVVMAFWLLTGLVFAIRRIESESSDVAKLEDTQGRTSGGSSSRSQLQEQAAAFGSSVQAAKAKHN